MQKEHLSLQNSRPVNLVLVLMMNIDILDELKLAEPKARQETLDGLSVYRYSTVTPVFTFESVNLIVDDNYLVDIVARESYDEELAQFLIKSVLKLNLKQLPEDTITVQKENFPKKWEFKSVIIVPPSIADRFKHKSETLGKITFWVFPAFDDEFRSSDTEKEFWHQLYRKDGWRIHVINWSRKKKSKPVWD